MPTASGLQAEETQEVVVETIDRPVDWSSAKGLEDTTDTRRMALEIMSAAEVESFPVSIPATGLWHVSRADLARATGLSASHISRVIRGHGKKVTLATASKLAQALGVTVEEFTAGLRAVKREAAAQVKDETAATDAAADGTTHKPKQKRGRKGK